METYGSRESDGMEGASWALWPCLVGLNATSQQNSQKLRQHPIAHIHIMFAPARRRCALALANSTAPAADSIPTFLLPRFAAPRSFTSTARCESKIGSLPLSVPPGVEFNVIAPKSVGGKGARTQTASMVHVKGPLGELSMEIPPYIAIDQQTMTLSLEDATDKKQKAMWGT